MRYITGNSLEANAERILRFIESYDNVSRNEIRRSVTDRVCSDTDFDFVMVTLLRAGLVKEVTTSNRIVYKPGSRS